MKSMDRKSLVVGNWKMELSHKGELEVAKTLKRLCKDKSWSNVDVVICPSYPTLGYIAEELAKLKKIEVGAQHVHWEESGAWTGEVSITQIASFVQWCIVGHSEQRKLTRMREELVGKTASNLLTNGINPVVCIGETEEQKEADQTIEVVSRQMKQLLGSITRTMLPKLTVAYEPVWAISTNNPGESPDPTETAETMLLLRKLASVEYGNEAAERMRVLYGGSVKSENVEKYVKEPGVDGVLVGSASLRPREFVEIVKKVEQTNS